MTPELHDLADAQWITHSEWAHDDPPLQAPVLRRRWDLGSRPVGVRLTIAGLGIWSAHINGKPVSTDVLEPGMTEFTKRVGVVSYDVTDLVTQGSNEFILQMGEGSGHVRELPNRYTKFVGLRVPPRARIGIVMEHADGTTERLSSDSRWSAMLGPTTLSHWFGGEDYDQRLEPLGWLTETGTADESWNEAVLVGAPADAPEAWSRDAPPMRVVERFEALERRLIDDRAVFDFGRNIAGRQVQRLGRDFPEGGRVEMWPSEYLDNKGHVDQRSTGQPIVDSYISMGGASEWRPQFCYHGFRYVEVCVFAADGAMLPAIADLVELGAERIMTNDALTGTFDSSDATLTGIYDLVTHASEANLVSVPTDCPHREKLGWLEQLHLVFEPLAHRFDIRAHLSDMIIHMRDAQTDDGLVPNTAPELVVFDSDPGYRDDVNWGSAIWQIPMQIYRTYGDLQPARDAWGAGLRYLDYVDGIAGDEVLDHGLADWISLDESTPRGIVAGYGHVAMLDSAAVLAAALGRTTERERFRVHAADIRRKIADRFVSRAHDGSLVCGSGSQASYALLMDLGGVLTDEEYALAAKQLVESIRAADHQITVGEIGLPSLVRELTKLGEHELLRTMSTRLDGPSYGRMLADGCTSLAEHWLGAKSNASANHFMLGYISNWLTGSVAGLAQHPESIGWKRARLAPAPLTGLASARTSYLSAAGEYVVDWHRTGDRLTVRAVVPEGGSAEFVTPASFTPADGHLPPNELAPGAHLFEFVSATESARLS